MTIIIANMIIIILLEPVFVLLLLLLGYGLSQLGFPVGVSGLTLGQSRRGMWSLAGWGNVRLYGFYTELRPLAKIIILAVS